MKKPESKKKPGSKKNPREAGKKEEPGIHNWVKSGSTRLERRELGKAARIAAPLESHAQLHITKTGRDIIKVLEKSNHGRVPELIPIRYGRMLASPFTFYRGSAALMAMDLAKTANTSFNVQSCGDCHVHNVGIFATPERKIVIDLNDFDETLPAPWEWDVKRMATSLVLAAISNEFSVEVGKAAAKTMAQGYREHLEELSELSPLQTWYSHIQFDEILEISDQEDRRRRKAQLQEAAEKSSPEIMTQKMTVLSQGKLRFKDMPPLISHVEGIGAGHNEKHAFEDYIKSLPEDRRVLLKRYELVDIARKVVGVGSVGTMCGVILLVSSDNDALILQLKEARESVLAPYVKPSIYQHQGQRVVAGQKLMQAASDMFLGWTTARREPHYHFYVRQLRDVKIGVNTAFWSKAEFQTFSRIIGEILARAHARTGDPAVMRGYLGKRDVFEEAISKYAVAYAKQTQEDYRTFVRACKSGQIKAKVID